MRIYGLTGGTGSGKSEVARRLQELGIPVIDADKVGHELLEPASPIFHDLVATFGTQILSEGKLDREKIGRIVFSDPDLLQRLNAIVHPRIKQIIGERCLALAQEGHRAVVVDAALLAENGKKDPWLSGLVLVVSDRNLRLRRLVEIRGMTPEQARMRIEAQSLPEDKVPLADWLIHNEGTIEELREQTDSVAAAMDACGQEN
jgi:dephospho-CoA kinase